MLIASYHPPVHPFGSDGPRITGLLQDGGTFYIHHNEESERGEIGIKLMTSSRFCPQEGHYSASFQVHYDGIAIMRELGELEVLKTFEEIKATTFYDVVQCFTRAGVLIRDNTPGLAGIELLGREMYEILAEAYSA